MGECWSIPRAGSEIIIDHHWYPCIFSFLSHLSYFIPTIPTPISFIYIQYYMYKQLWVVTAVPNREWVLPIPLFHILVTYYIPSWFYSQYYLGPVPSELSDLTPIKEAMIAQCRAKCWIVQLKEENSTVVMPETQWGLHGHIIIYPQHPSESEASWVPLTAM